MVLLHVAVTLAVTVAAYFFIFREAWRKLKQECECNLTPKARKRTFSAVNLSWEKNRFQAAQIHAEAKTAKTMALILGVHMLGLAPYLAVVVWRYQDNSREVDRALGVAKKVRSIGIKAQGS